MYYCHYNSPVGRLLLACSQNALTGLWIEGQKYFGSTLTENAEENENYPVLIKTKAWLDRYFEGKKPDITELTLSPIGTDFRLKAWKLLCKIPYGEVATYQKIAEQLSETDNKQKVSPRAVGNAVGHNPIMIVIPCHRVVGKNGSLTGYSAGTDIKQKLLKFEIK